MKLQLYKVSPDYLRYLHAQDYRVSVKFNNRPFVGVLTMINDIYYVLPLTSQTTAERKRQGKKKRAAAITTFVKNSAKTEIANILHNNMIPVTPDELQLLDIDAQSDTYEANEIRYIRKHTNEIIEKARQVYQKRLNNYNEFYVKTCCDFKKLEKAMNVFKSNVDRTDNPEINR